MLPFPLDATLGAFLQTVPAVSGLAALAPAATATTAIAASAHDAMPLTPMANLDPDDDYVVAPPEPVEDCEARLEAAGVEFSSSRIPVHENKSGDFMCGAEQIVRYTRGPEKIRWRGSPKMTCAMALALARFETAIQEEAVEHLGARVAKIVHMGTYNCREMAEYPGWVSEHSYANALDVKAFVLANGRQVSVLDGWKATGKRGQAERDFLEALGHRAYDERHFSVVLTPAFDRLHRNHFHLDLARYRVDGNDADS